MEKDTKEDVVIKQVYAQAKGETCFGEKQHIPLVIGSSWKLRLVFYVKLESTVALHKVGGRLS